MPSDKTLYLIRGAQGSGKTTLAELLSRGIAEDYGCTAYHIEADEFWLFIGHGEYAFDASRLGEAHRWCQDGVRRFMEKDKAAIVVSNTFIKKSEMQPYIEMAEANGYTVVEYICRGEFPNTHGVPEEVVKKKREAIEL